MGVTLVLSVVGTVVIAMIVKAVIGLRPDHRGRGDAASTRPTTAKSGYHYDEAGGLSRRSRAGEKGETES